MAPPSPAAAKAVAASAVVVFSIPACPYCKKAKEALAQAGVAFVDVDVSKDEQLRAKVREVSGSRTVPQVSGSAWGRIEGVWRRGGVAARGGGRDVWGRRGGLAGLG